MITSHFFKLLPVSKLFTIAAILANIAVLANSQAARASLIGQTIHVFSSVGGLPFEGEDDVLVVDGGGPELSFGDGSDHGANFFLDGDFYDFKAERITVHFGPGSGGQGALEFTNLSWGDTEGVITAVDYEETSGQLSSAPHFTILNGGTGFEASLDCSAVNGCSTNGITYDYILTVDHVVPEPITLMLGLGAIVLALSRRQMRA